MRIAFITYEYPPDIAQGGIATYVGQAAGALKKRGHDVEIFCGSHSRDITENINGILVHRCKTTGPVEFRKDCLPVFSGRHLYKLFDIIESPEIHANGLEIKKKYPGLPLVVKLHMPLYLQMRLYNYYTTRLTKLRIFLGCLRRGKVRWFGKYNYHTDIDYEITSLASGIVSPSTSLKSIIKKEWKLNSDLIKVIPYPFEASQKLLDLPVKNEMSNTVSFIGKLNVHKGLVNLVKIIPLVVKKHPDVLFTLTGSDGEFPAKKMKMSGYIRQQLNGYERNYIIRGGLVYDDVMKELAETAVCIFPSIWENFPLVCLEAMAAGKAIIGSREGGMKEMLDDRAGILVDPVNVKQMAAAVIKLLDSEPLRREYGTRARLKVLAKYNKEIIGKQMEEHYREVMNKKRNSQELAKN